MILLNLTSSNKKEADGMIAQIVQKNILIKTLKK